MRTHGRDSDVSAHATRMALGRQQRLTAGRRGVTREQHTAQGILDDFANSGIDEDLEMLRAGWATGCSAAVQRRGGSSPDFALDWCDSQTELNCRGDLAQRRLKNIQYLRGVAAVTSSSSSASDLLCLSNCTARTGSGSSPSFSSRSSAWNAPTSRLRKERHFSSSLDGFFETDLPFSFSSTTPAIPKASRRRWRGPLDPDASDEDECLQLMLEDSGIARSRCTPTSLRRRRAPRTEDAEDPWSAWESRWTAAFQEFDARERERRFMRLAQEEEERERLWEEANKTREADAKFQQERAKRTASKASQAHEEETRRKAKTKYASASGESKEKAKSSQGCNTGASNASTSSQPPPAMAENDTCPKFANFEAYESAWNKFEVHAKNGSVLSFSDIPWPTKLPTISGASSSDSAAERKKKLRGALLRWHPDKWTALLNLVCESDRARVTEMVKEVTRRILAEKDRFGG